MALGGAAMHLGYFWGPCKGLVKQYMEAGIFGIASTDASASPTGEAVPGVANLHVTSARYKDINYLPQYQEMNQGEVGRHIMLRPS